jgi:tetratricopeptide (TPR) repeat protein
MRTGLCVFLCLTAFSPFAVAQTLDKAKLRQSIEMPNISSFLGVRFSSNERDQLGNKFDPAQKVGDLQKKLNGTTEDAKVYLELRAFYRDVLKDEQKARDMAVKAESVLRPHMQTTDAKQAHLLTNYGSVLEFLADSPSWSDCEKWARRAVSVGPQDWRTWAYLAHTRHQQIPIVLMGGDEKLLPKFGRTQEIVGALHLRRLRAEHVDDAEKVLNEVLQLHDKAKEVAPNDPARQEQRYAFRVTEIVLRNAISAFRAQKPAYPTVQLDRVLLDELQATAKLQPDHLLWQSQLVHYLTIVGWRQNQDKDGRLAKTFRAARPEDDTAIREALARIDKMTSDARGETVVFCHTLAATLHASMKDYIAVEKHARKVLQIDQKNQIAWEQLEHALYHQERYADMLQEVQTMAQAVPSARSCCVLAKALAKNQRHDLAETACLAGLKQEPTEVHCLLGMAALLLRKDDKALEVAGDLLNKARRECRPEAGPTVFAEVEYLSAIHQALSGEQGFARLTLDRLRTDNPDSPRYEKALNAIGR